MPTRPLRVIPLGGLGEIGRNMLVLEYGEDIIVIDTGLMFPREEMLGVDLVIPDISYLLEHKRNVRGIILTHGHEDHIGALPYVLRELNAPVFATRLTLGLVDVKLREKKVRDATLNTIEPGEEFVLGAFRITPFRVNHSIPDAVGYVVETPQGLVVHTGDFKLDHTPVDGQTFDLGRLAAAGAQGVLLLLSDSTYAEVPGYTPSERLVGEALDRIIAEAPGRVIVASFASLISRVQQVIDAASRHGRVVAVVGRSMVDNAFMAQEMGYLHAPEGVLRRLHEIRGVPSEQVVLMTTGAQGEPTSALVRMANGDHREVRIQPEDTVIISSNPIPGNEMLVNRTIDNLFRIGARVFYTRLADVHVRGHASQEELKLVIQLTRPRFFVPVHGDFRHLFLHTRLAQSLGVLPENAFTLTNGDVLEIQENGAKLADVVPYENVYVDGSNIGDVTQVILRDRRHLSQDGVVVVILAYDKKTGKIVGQPDIVSRGFVESEDSEEMWDRSRQVIVRAFDRGKGQPSDASFVQQKVRESLANFLYQETRQRPLILPLAVEV